MAEISLRAYQQEIQDMIDHGHFDEAVAHCQNVLGRYPKHVETYRLLGKAYLEQGRHAEAADVFQRVLSAIPDDFLSHVAMAIMAEDAGNLDRAIWHMERAFEVNPSNPTVQQEVRRLRGRRDGVEPSRLRMTRASLGRMYLKGGLDAQAAVEVSAALAEDPERPDLQVVLANAYWKMGKSAEAADVCNRLLDKLPYCLEANQILARILWRTGRKQEAQDIFRRLATLDPYVGVRPPTDDGRMPDVSSEAVQVDRLSWTPPLEGQKGPPPGWAEGLGLKKEQVEKVEIPEWLEPSRVLPTEPASPFGAEAEESPFHTPDWLGEGAAELPDTSGIQAERLLGPEEPEAALARTGQELPDWLKGGPAPEESAPAPPAPASWLTPESPKPQEPTGDFAEWLKAVGGEESLTRATEGLPEWLKPEEVKAQPAETAESLPDWLKGETAAPSQTTEEYPEISSESPSRGEAPLQPEGSAEWLPQPAREQIVSPFDLAAAGESPRAEKLPDWLEAEMRETSGIAAGEELAGTREGTAVSGAEKPAAGLGPTPPWLGSTELEASFLSEEGKPEGLEPGGPAGEVAPAIPAAELPDWLKPEPAAPEHAAAEGAIPDWLRVEAGQSGGKASLSADLGAERETRGPAEEPAKGKETEIPEWLASTSGQSPTPPSSAVETPAREEEIPDWLKRIASEASSVVVPEEAAPSEPEMETGELPPWLESRQPGASDTISKWLGERLGPRPGTQEKAVPKPEPEDLPEWLRPAAEVGPEPEQPALEEKPPREAEPVAPEGRQGIEKPGEQAPPDWLRTALDLAQGELSTVLPAEGPPSVQAVKPVAQPAPAPIEAREVPPMKVEAAPVPARQVAGPAKEPVSAPAPERKAGLPFVPAAGEEEVVGAAERAEWIPVVEPAPAPPVEKIQPRPKAPSRPGAGKVPAAARPKPRRMTKEEATSLLVEGRKCLGESREQDAAAIYQRLLESGRLVEEMANDLEGAVREFPDSSTLWQLLGDASSRLGRLQRAYEAYGKALEKI